MLGETYETELAKLKPPQTKQCVASVFVDSSYQLHHSLADIRQRKSPSTKHQHLLPPLVHPRQRSFSPRLSANTKLHLGLQPSTKSIPNAISNTHLHRNSRTRHLHPRKIRPLRPLPSPDPPRPFLRHHPRRLHPLPLHLTPRLHYPASSYCPHATTSRHIPPSLPSRRRPNRPQRT